MGILRTVAIFMFACGQAFCQQPARANEPQQTWRTLHDAGVAAYQSHSLNEAISALEAALPLAATPASAPPL